MVALINKLTHDELARTEEFYRRLKAPDLSNIETIIKLVDSIANTYFSSTDPDRNYNYFCEDERIGNPFFGIYLIGGYLNKEGERPDIDLLIATNMRWREGFIEDYEGSEEPIWKELKKVFTNIKKSNELPNDYNIGATKGKVLITINPYEGKKIDINYVRSWEEEGFKFIDEEQFYKLDVRENGEALPRLELYRNTTQITLPEYKY